MLAIPDREGSGGHVRSRRTGSPSPGGQCVLACYNMIIPYLCPEMSAKQKEALSYCVKNILLSTPTYRSATGNRSRNLGLRVSTRRAHISVTSPWIFPSPWATTGFPVLPMNPACCTCCELHAVLASIAKINIGLGDTNWSARLSMSSSATFVISLARILFPGGFDPAHDIQAITVNRWPHG